MHEPQTPQRKLRILWIVAGLFLLFITWFCIQLFGPDPAIVISKETTFITEPLGTDGLPDYEAYYLQQASEGITPENNAAVLIWQAMWPGELEQQYWLPMCNALGMDQVPSAEGSLVSPFDDTILHQITLDLAKQFPDPEADDEEEEVEEEEYDDSEYGGSGDWYGQPWESRLRDEMAEAVVKKAISRPWTSEQLPALATWVQQNQQPLDLLLEASRRPRYYSPPPNLLDNQYDSLIAMLLPDIQQMRTVARALNVRAMWHLGEGRTAEAWQDLLACHRLARLTAENDTLIGQLVAIAIDGLTSERTKLFLHEGNLPSDKAREIMAELNNLGTSSFCVRALDQGERMWYLDAVLHLAGDRTNAMDEFGVDSAALRVLDFARIDWNIALRTGNRWYDKIVTAAKKPTRDQRNAEFDVIDLELNQVLNRTSSPSTLIGSALSNKRRSEIVTNVLISLFLPATQAAFNAEDRSNTRLELTRLAAALAVYRAEQGEYPKQLTDLVPAVLQKLPIDMYSGKPFIYQRKDDGGYLLYSVFENEIDDGGTNQSGEVVKGEWVAEVVDNSEECDLVIRVPAPTFKMPPPPVVGDFGEYGGAYVE